MINLMACPSTIAQKLGYISSYNLLAYAGLSIMASWNSSIKYTASVALLRNIVSECDSRFQIWSTGTTAGGHVTSIQ